jgi:TrmH family RNA methyltransferase
MIESPQNEKIKFLTRLISDNRFRKKLGIFAVEGKQENERALKFGFEAQEFFICETIFKDKFPDGKIHLVSEKIYEKFSYRTTSEGIIGVFKTRNFDLTAFKPKENSTIIIVESVEKPGNLGAILRSCEAFSIDSLIVTDTKVDFYNPNVIRSSVGCLFGMNIFQSSNEEIFEFLNENDFQIFTTFMNKKSVSLSETDLRGKSALLFGTEHSGLSDFWMEKGKNILIPTSGTIDSLNLSNAVAICCYEILRQKNK